jgi:hypothetical protein
MSNTDLTRGDNFTPMELASHFFKSQSFKGLLNPEQAFVKILAGMEFGLKPFQAMASFDLVQGNVQFKSIALAAHIRASGRYDYKVLELTDTICKIAFFRIIKGERELDGEVIFTIEDAKKLGTNNANYTKNPKNMLFARAMSNGAKWHCPDLFMVPVYTEGDVFPSLPERFEKVYEMTGQLERDEKAINEGVDPKFHINLKELKKPQINYSQPAPTIEVYEPAKFEPLPQTNNEDFLNDL